MDVSTLFLIAGMGGIFVALFLALSAIGVFTNESRGVSRSLAVVQAFSSAPKAMQEELEPSFYERVLVPFMNRFVRIGQKLTPADHSGQLRRRLDVAGNPKDWTVERVASLKFICFAGGLALSLVIAILLGLGMAPAVGLGVLASVAGYFAPNMYLYQKGYDRTDQMRKALPDALDLLSISVEAGLAFDSALAHVAKNTTGPVADEFARVLQEMQIGMGRSNALRALGERTTLPEMRGFASAMVQADAFGIPIGQVLRVQSSEIRVKRRQRAEELAQKVPVKVLLPLIFFILPTLFLIVLGPAIISIMGMFGGM